MRAAREIEEVKTSDRSFLAVLTESVRLVHEAAIPFAVIGGVASAAYGRPRHTNDIDFLCRAETADAVLSVLAGGGFLVEQTNPAWIYKAFRDDVVVDVIFKIKSDIYFDAEMAERIRWITFRGVDLPVAPPEDLIVTKAATTDETSPRHWYDALAILTGTEIDWDYLLRRSRNCPNRVASLLHFALSSDIPVPAGAVRSLDQSIADMWR